jgi:hypothetical protein
MYILIYIYIYIDKCAWGSERREERGEKRVGCDGRVES